MDRATKMHFTLQSEGETLVGNLFLPEAEPAGLITGQQEYSAAKVAELVIEALGI